MSHSQVIGEAWDPNFRSIPLYWPSDSDGRPTDRDAVT
jgi:hypothetical protein